MTADLDTMMARLADGERSAFAAVYEQLRGPVSRLCQHLLPDSADVKDAFQEAMQKIFERAPADYDRTRPALPWALALAGWECRTVLRQRQRQRRHETAGSAVSEVAGEQDEQSFVQRDLEAAALAALGTLTPVDRQTLLATFWEEVTPTSHGATFRKRRERAIARLRVNFRRIYGFD